LHKFRKKTREKVKRNSQLVAGTYLTTNSDSTGATWLQSKASSERVNSISDTSATCSSGISTAVGRLVISGPLKKI
jgi:hypothetical protein